MAAREGSQNGHVAGAEGRFCEDASQVNAPVQVLDDTGDVLLDTDVGVKVLDENDERTMGRGRGEEMWRAGEAAGVLPTSRAPHLPLCQLTGRNPAVCNRSKTWR